MRLLTTLPEERSARRFEQYLLALPLPCALEQTPNGWNLWIEREDDLDRARTELLQFQADPASPRYDAAAPQARALQKQQQEREQRLRENYIDYRTASVPGLAQSTPLATYLLIGLCLVFAALTQLGAKPDPWGYLLTIDDTSRAHQIEQARKQMEEIVQREGVWSAITREHTFSPVYLDSIRHGQLWRLFTPMLLHYGALHLIFNMWWLYSLGGILERRYGTLFFLLLLLVSEVASSVAQYYWSGPNFGGMSGVIYALFGYVWIRGKTDPRFGLEIPQQTVLIMLAWLVLCMTGALGPIANAAHLVGLIVGVIWAAIPRGWHNYRRWQRQL